MIFDKQNLFSDAQAVTVTAASTNVIDFGASSKPVGGKANIIKDLGKGNPVPIRIQVVEAFATLTSLTFALQVDDNEAFGSAKTVFTSGAVAVADLKAGYVVPIEYVTRGTDERYMRLNYTVAGTTATAGKVTAGIVLAGDDNA